jgi:2-desacetyl-2-hydroxyethyl bacteriochlorophyllide A dehydrogenase
MASAAQRERNEGGGNEMKAVVVTEPGQWGVEEVPDPAPGPDEVVVEVERCGICGTDLHVVAGEIPTVRYPVIPGHEFSGRVVALGPGASGPALGTFVAVDPMVYCGHCQQCRGGWTNLCATGGGLGTTVDGAFARYVTVRSDRCEPVPESVPAEWAPITEPLSCALHALDRAGPVVGADVLVTGAGPAGLLLTRLLSLGGARVDVVERTPLRREAATLFGADRAVASTDQLDRERGWQIVVDASGNPAAIQEGLSLVRRAGTFVVFGVARDDARVELSPYEVFKRELTIVGTNSVRHSFGRAMAVLASGRIPADKLLDEPVPLDEIGEAFDRTRQGLGLKATVLAH